MARPAMNPNKKKQSISVTLTPEQLQQLRSMAAEAGESTSATLGRLISAEARRLAKRSEKQQPPAAAWTPTGRTATTEIRKMLTKEGGPGSNG